MARKKKPPPQDEDPGAPEWMVTFSDCMTLLLTFFVLLLTFSSFDERVFQKLRVIYCDAFPTIHSKRQASKEALVQFEEIRYSDEIDIGSEKATLEDGTDGALFETYEFDHKKHKVFLFRSDEIFWGKGTRISTKGQQTFSTLAEFLKRMPCRVVISENDSQQSDAQFGMSRAWTVIEHMAAKHQIKKDRFSLSAASTLGQKGFSMFNLTDETQPERILEIVLLEQGLYN